MQSALKTVSARLYISEEDFMLKFNSSNKIGFKNGCYDLKQQQLQPHQSENYLLYTIPYDFKPIAGPLYKICPTICQWLAERVNHEEIFMNMLLACIYCVVLEILNPERFFVFSGTSATGKTTFINLLISLMSGTRFYAAGPADLVQNFGLQHFRGFGKYLLVTHDLGVRGVFEEFTSLIRSFVSTGEVRWVNKKYDDFQEICFTGLYVTSSNGNPFANSQQEGLINRRLLMIPFEKPILPEKTKTFDQLFPENERENLVCFAVQQNAENIRHFIQMSSKHPLVQQTIFESYQMDQTNQILKGIIDLHLVPKPNSEMPFGNLTDQNSCFGLYLEKTKQLNLPTDKKLSLPKFRQQLTSLIQTLYPDWQVNKQRKSIYQGQKQTKIWVLKGVEFQLTEKETVEFETSIDSSEEGLKFQPFRDMDFWLKIEDLTRISNTMIQINPLIEHLKHLKLQTTS